jgi:hypothetical protein
MPPPIVMLKPARPPSSSAIAMKPRSWAKTSTSLLGGIANTVLNFRGR